jgi:AcrR family transcriptional regulator
MSLNLLLQELDISKGQFYYWFEDKADLFLTILGQFFDQNVAHLEAQTAPSDKEDFWAYLRNGRLLQEELWGADEFVGLALMIREHIPRNHPMFERLEVCAKPVEDHWKNRLKLGQDWGLVRSDLSVDTLFEVIDGVGDVFYGTIISRSMDSESNAEAGALHGMLGPVFRFLLQEPGAPL